MSQAGHSSNALLGAARTTGAAPAARNIVTELLQALQAEGAALVAGDADCLAAQAARKADLLLALVPALQAAQAREATGLHALLREAQHLNQINARVLASRISINRARTDALLQAASPSAVYGAQGAIAPLRAGTHSVTSA